jgi:DNA-binding YbaB/EbfC family protein
MMTKVFLKKDRLMRNLAQMMQKAKAVQENIASMKQELEIMQFEGESGGGAVKVIMNGRGEMLSLVLNPAMVNTTNADDLTLIEDLIVVATNDAKAKADAARSDKTKEITGGIPLPPGLDQLL